MPAEEASGDRARYTYSHRMAAVGAPMPGSLRPCASWNISMLTAVLAWERQRSQLSPTASLTYSSCCHPLFTQQESVTGRISVHTRRSTKGSLTSKKEVAGLHAKQLVYGLCSD